MQHACEIPFWYWDTWTCHCGQEWIRIVDWKPNPDDPDDRLLCVTWKKMESIAGF